MFAARVAALALLVLVVAAGSASGAALLRYVALGDSYSAGTGTGDDSLGERCQRSRYAYPALVAQGEPSLRLVFVACAGATTEDVRATQLSALTAATALVTLTAGGNDAGFASVIARCVLPWPVTCGGKIDEADAFVEHVLPGRLDALYAAIRRQAPAAQVFVLGYPRLFARRRCGLLRPVSLAEQDRLNDTADRLRDVLQDRADAAGFVFLDATEPFAGHELCTSAPWLHGLTIPVGTSYHPNRDGHRLGYRPLVRDARWGER